MSYTIIRPKSHEEWLQERSKGVGSSDAGTIMGVSPFCTPYQLWERKTGKASPLEESEAMFNGHILEKAVAEWFEKKTLCPVDKNSEGDWLAVDNEKPYLRVSPDRIYWKAGTPESERTYANARILEIKSTSKAVDPENLPDYWFCQLQYQMGVMGIKEGCLGWITGSPTLHFSMAEVEFNGGFYKTLVSRIESFWKENVLKGIPPKITTGEDMLRMYPKAKDGLTVLAEEDIRNDWELLKECRREIKELEIREKALTDSLKVAMGESGTLAVTDKETGEVTIAAQWKNPMRSVFDARAFKKDCPAQWEQVKRESEGEIDADKLKALYPDLWEKYSSKVPMTRKFVVK